MSASAPDRPAREPRLWVFNLDAELELQSLGPYQTPKQMARAQQPALVHARRLLAAGDVELSEPMEQAGRELPRIGRSWCPTPSAKQRLLRAGAEPEPSPDVEALRRVNHRRFALELGGGAPGARYVDTPSDLEATLREPSVTTWLCKRPFGFAGRGQRRIGREPSPDDRRWLHDSLRRGGFLAEPWLELSRELALHGHVDRTGYIELGRICVQHTDQHRSWTRSELVAENDLDALHARALREQGQTVAVTLFAAAYFGPFGIDAYLWRSRSGEVRLNSLSEINARYSMGYAVGMAHLLTEI